MADPDASKAQLRTVQRRINAWRAEKLKDPILAWLRQSAMSSTEPLRED